MAENSKLYVGNLDYSVTSEDLQELFGAHGQVKEVNVIEGRGFAFVEMSSQEEAQKAKEALDGSEYKGRNLKISEARPKSDRGGRGGRDGGGPGGGFRRF